jgi:dihydroflavonol-4-reductase
MPFSRGISVPVQVCVTGASGFIGTHVVRALAARGHRVRAVVRDTGDAEKTAPLRALPGVELAGADITREGSLDPAVAGCDAVVHAASAVRLTARDPQREIVDVAVGGTRNVLRAAERAGTVRRLVLTSSIAAISDPERPPGHVYTEADWNESATVETAPYDLSKVLAEREAAAFCAALPAGRRIELTAIHPTMVVGPVLSKVHLRSSPTLVRNLLEGKLPGVPLLSFGFVDVRDVAEAHARALEVDRPSARYICSHEVWWLRDVAAILRRHFPGERVPRLLIPSPLMFLVPLFEKRVTYSFLRKHLGRWKQYSNERIRAELGITFRPVEESLVDTARSILEAGWARAR